MKHRTPVAPGRGPGRETWPTVFALLAGLLLGLVAPSAELDRGLQVWRAELHPRAATGRLALVEMDARSVAELPHWPWPRTVYAEAIAALRKAGADTIAFDVDFSAYSTPATDDDLSRAIATSDVPVILSTFRQNASQNGTGVLESLPIAALREHAQLAAVNIFADGDGLVRSYPFAIRTGGTVRPSIGAMLAGAEGRADAAFPIDLSIDPRTVPHVSFIDLLHGRVPAGALKGRSVLIGASAIELGDRYPLPGRGVIPGPLIQLLAAETLLQGSAPNDLGALAPLVLALAVIGLVRGRTAARRLAIYGGTAALLIALPMVTEWAKLGTFDIVPALAALVAGLIVRTTAEAWSAVREARLTDADTGLPNGRALRSEAGASDGGAALVLRIANFGDVAGVLGQQRASELILRVAERVALAAGGLVYRVEEGALAWHVASDDQEEQAGRVDSAAAMLRAPFDIAGRQIELVFAFGVADSREADFLAKAVAAADRAVSRSLRLVRHTADLGRENDWRLSLAQELDRALGAGDIWVAYQPKLDIHAGRIVAAEALVRWRHPERGAIPPDDFIPALEESGRIADLTLHVLDRALDDCRGWAMRGLDLDVAVNLSALLPADPGFIRRLEAMLDRYPDAVPHLTFEVTESASMSDPERAIEALNRLAALGVAISIDDYGTGQSTLSYLKRLPAREIKIDKSFVLGIERSRSDQAMVRSTIELAHELGFKVVAEGVETEAALQMLASFGCDIGQGWHIGRPVPAAELETAAGARTALAA